jgi:hypothetical protein
MILEMPWIKISHYKIYLAKWFFFFKMQKDMIVCNNYFQNFQLCMNNNFIFGELFYHGLVFLSSQTIILENWTWKLKLCLTVLRVREGLKDMFSQIVKWITQQIPIYQDISKMGIANGKGFHCETSLLIKIANTCNSKQSWSFIVKYFFWPFIGIWYTMISPWIALKNK